MNHDCNETEPLLSGYLDGELTQGDRQRVELILEDCAECARVFDEMKKLRQHVGGIPYETMTETEKSKMSRSAEASVGASVGQVLFLAGLVLVYGVGAYWVCSDLITDAEFSKTGDAKDKVPMFIRIGVPALVIGLGILFFTVLLQRIKAAKTDKYTDVEI